jgi:methionyl-tRNA formyltransferase
MKAPSARYLFASSKDWHRDRYEAIRQELSLDCAWVSSPDQLLQEVASSKPRYIFFPHWSSIVPSQIWRDFECVCFHMTDLPFGRGGSPLQNLISRGYTDTVLTALRMVEALDAGPVYAKRPMALQGSAAEIYARAGDISFDLIRWIIENEPSPLPQQGPAVNFKRRKPEQSELPRTNDMNKIFDHIRMLDAPGYPAAFLERDGLRFEFSDAAVEGEEIVARVVISKSTGGDQQ